MSTMKINRLFTLFFVMMLFSCNDKDDAIRLFTRDQLGQVHYYTELFISVGSTTIHIEGGDGNYRAMSDKPDVLKAETSDEYLIMSGIAPGNAVISVTDGSGHSTTLPVTVTERTSTIIIEDQSIRVELEADETFTGNDRDLEEWLEGKKEEIADGLKKISWHRWELYIL